MWRKWRWWASLAGIVALLAAGGGQAFARELAEQPVRVSQEAVPARIAFTSQNQLWLLDGQTRGAKPMQVTTDGVAQIVGWSADGQWLLFLHYNGTDAYAVPGFLWAVKADGSGAFQVDQRPVMDQPKWSPAARQFAYLVNTGSAEDPKPLFVVKEMQGNQAAEVQSVQHVDFADFSWMPDGKRFLVSIAAAKDRAITLALRDLAGKTTAAFPLADPPNMDEGIFAWAARAMTISPDGTRVAYYLQYNSASLSADGVPIQLFDLSEPGKKPVDLGTGLINRQWLHWSPDSKQLAFIEGTDRMATHNKHLKLTDRDGKLAAMDSQPDQVDTTPVWTAAAPYSLFFTRGKGTDYHFDPKRVMVPGQRIWQQPAGGPVKQATQGTPLTADYFPSPSPEGGQLLFVRLDNALHGSLYLSAQGKETEVLRQVTGEIGYYANYLPPWIEVYWTKQAASAEMAQ